MTVQTIHQITRRPAVRLTVAVAVTIALAGAGSGRPGVHAQSNPIALENAMAGTVQATWDISGAGDPTIQGFATDISVNTGDTVNFKIQTDSVNFTIDIYRLGYYGGTGARNITTLGPFTQAQNQGVACATDPTTGLVDCGNWSVSASWPSSGAVSGIYLAKLTRIDTGGASHIVFVVRDDARQADVVVQTSDTTWQAYNQYGGASLYCADAYGVAGGPVSNAGSAYGCATRASKVSYNRPFDTRGHDAQSFVFNAEYPMTRWLEANGYDVKYVAGVDTDRHGADLSGAHKPKAFLSMGHDEYWSGNQRTMIENARNAGVNLAFFSGNEMFWKTRFEPSIVDGTTYRTLVSYKETLSSAKTDPAIDGAGNPIWTGTWRDPRFSPPADGGRPENGVTGNIWTVNSGTTGITVPASMAGLRFWQHTRVAALTSGVATLSDGTLGYEWDEDLDNGARPTGLIHLSSTTVNGVEKIVDYGALVGANETATHSLTLYRHASGAFVFGAGTVQWSWGLDGNHDRGGSVPDQAVQQSTVNLLADMGAHAATLQNGADGNPLLTPSPSTDTFPPTSAITSPASGDQVQSGNRVTITGTATDNGGGSVAGVEVSVDGGATWHLAQGAATWTFDWTPGTLGAGTILSRAIDDSGNLETAGTGVTVTVVAGNCPCNTLWKPSVTPIVASVADANAVELGVKFKSDVDGFVIGIRFYKGPANNGTHQGSLWTIDGTRLASAVFTTEVGTGWKQVSFSSPVHITANTTYVASYHTNVGGYAADTNYFMNGGVDSPPLHALPSNTSGGNGVFSYGASVFPSHTSNNANYWVDVVFAETIADESPLTISGIIVRVIDGSSAVVSWTTSKAATSQIDYSTDPGLPDSPPGLTLTRTDGAFVTQHSMTLTGLTFNATYYFNLTAIDEVGNVTLATAPGFTVPGPTLHDTASVDFLAGTQGTSCDQNGQNCVATTYVAETGDGEVILAPTTGSEFSGPTLPSGWIEVPWSSEGYSIIDNGILLVDGARVAFCVTDPQGVCVDGETTTSTPSAIFTSPHFLQFRANFSGDMFQHAGLAQTLGSGAEPWALFSTLGGDGNLYARTNTGDTAINTSLGPGLLAAFHLFGIDWKADSVDYYIDGALVLSHPLAVAGPLRPVAASDFNPFGGVVFVDWMRMDPYAANGTFVSRVFDALSSVDWHTIQWTANAPAGTSLAISVRTGDTATPDGSWTDFVPYAASGVLNLHSRYIQYQVVLSSNNTHVTPDLDDIIISTDQAPVAVNDAASTTIDTAYTFSASGSNRLTANDTDADTPLSQLRVIAVSAPAHGTATLNSNGSVTYAPASGFAGNDSFTYTITDGLLTSNAATVSMAVGGHPIANPTTATVLEDSSANSIDVLANDTHTDANQTLTVTIVTQGAHGVVAITGGGAAVTYTPNAGFVGTDSFSYTISDTNGITASSTVSVIVSAVNHAPSFVKGADQTVLEDAAAQTISGWATAISAGAANESGQTLNFITGNNNNALFASQPAVASNGTLTFTTAANANGSATVTVQVHDDGGTANGGTDTSGPQTFTISVTPVNDVPSFVKGADQTVLEDAAAQTISGWATAISAGPADESGQTLNFIVGNNNNALFASQPAVASNGTLTFTTAANASGSATVTVQLHDDGGTANGGTDTSAPQTFIISATPVNDVPSFVKGADQTVLEDAAAQTISGWATAISAGPANEGGQALDFIVGNNNNALFASQPAVASNGTLTYTVAANANGSATVTVQLHDDGGTANGGTDTSAPQTFIISVTPVNDVPSFTKGADQTVLEDAGPQTVSGWATAISAGAANEGGQTLDFIVTNNNNPLFATQPAVASNGTLTFTTAANASGSATVTVKIHDDGGTANGGADTSATQTFIITTTLVNDAPTFTKGADRTVQKNSGAQSVTAWATNMSAGPSDEAAQTLNFIVSNNNAALFSAAPAIASNGTLTFTPATGAAGIATVTVSLHDNGGTANGGVDTSAPQTFTITVFDPPPVALCQNVTVAAPLIGYVAASINNGSSDPDGGSVTLAQVPPGPYVGGQTSVTLRVTDTAAQTTTCVATVTVTPFTSGASFGFEEASGNTVVDSSGNGNNGTFNAANGPQRTAAGRFGKGMVFDGVDDLITVADSNSLDLTSAMTLMAWVKVTNQTGWRDILMKQNGNDLAYAVYANNNQTGTGQPSGYGHTGTVTKNVNATESALTGRWMHVAVTYGGGSLKMYINGVLETTLAATGNLPVTTGPLTLGGDLVWLDEYFSGQMDEVRIMGVALSVTDIRTLMRTPVVPGSATPATDPTGLVAAYNFDDGTATDITGHGHNGTLNGAVSASGMFGQSLAFNGANSLVAVADASDLHFTTGMTLEAYVRPTTLSGWRALLLKENPGALSYALYGSDQAQHPGSFVKIAGYDFDARSAASLPLNAWSHVVATYDKSEGALRLWVDGIPLGVRQVTGDITVGAGSLFMGGDQVWGEYFNGQIDNVRLYNRALGIVEIQTNQFTPVF